MFYQGPHTCRRSQARTRTLSGIECGVSSAHRGDVAVGRPRCDRPRQSPQTAVTRGSAWMPAFRLGVSPARALRAAPSVQVVRELAVGRARVQALAFPWALQRDFPSALPAELGTHCAFVFCHYSLPRSAGGWEASGPRVVHLVLPPSPQGRMHGRLSSGDPDHVVGLAYPGLGGEHCSVTRSA